MSWSDEAPLRSIQTISLLIKEILPRNANILSYVWLSSRERGRIIRSGESEWLLEYYEYSTQSINHAYLAQLLPATRVYSTFYIPVSSVPSFSLQFLFLPPFFSRRLPVAPHLATYTRFNRLLNFFSSSFKNFRCDVRHLHRHFTRSCKNYLETIFSPRISEWLNQRRGGSFQKLN